MAAPEAEARALAAGVLGEAPEVFYARLAEPVPLPALARWMRALAARRAGAPLQLILGTAEFCGLTLGVAPGVFIPRPETEGLVGLALRELTGRTRPRVLDVGTGTGAIALAIKAARPDARVHACDPDPRALALAQANADRLGLSVAFHPQAFPPELGGLDLIVANPPYLPEGDRPSAPTELAFEPDQALYAGTDGLAVARPLARRALSALRPGGVLLLELDPRNAALLGRELVALGYRRVCTLPDLAGRPRYLLARAPATKTPGQLELGEDQDGGPAVGADPRGAAGGQGVEERLGRGSA